MFNNLIIHAQSYQYFAKLAAFPVILAWAITILACVVVGKSTFPIPTCFILTLAVTILACVVVGKSFLFQLASS